MFVVYKDKEDLHIEKTDSVGFSHNKAYFNERSIDPADRVVAVTNDPENIVRNAFPHAIWH